MGRNTITTHRRATTPHRAIAALAAAPLLLVPLLTGCEDDDSDTPTSTPPAATTSPQSDAHTQSAGEAPQSDSSTSLSPIAGDAWVEGPSTHEAVRAEGSLVLHAVRAATHEGFTRIVLEFASPTPTTALPGWKVRWNTTPVEQGRGRNIPLPEGTTTALDLSIDGTTMPISEDLRALAWTGEKVQRVGDLAVISDGTFEDITHLLIAAPEERAYQVALLENPTRLVIDVRD